MFCRTLSLSLNRTIEKLHLVPDAPLSIVVDGTTLESTDVDAIEGFKMNGQYELESAAVTLRELDGSGRKVSKPRPISEGYSLTHQLKRQKVYLRKLILFSSFFTEACV